MPSEMTWRALQMPRAAKRKKAGLRNCAIRSRYCVDKLATLRPQATDYIGRSTTWT